ncbi:hypothetical protein [Chamaesiphon sp. OTE_8_metabat_110]|uniref:hypothetical protein n=1 Tax=Chamaesiphon sp. OTE_8_metabat_110 TaxID=2964696 RepID=UPI00286C419F|nr:hypothetical protein [Chamaesiphon sp. OTE_8_metabat_110]
MLQPIILDNRIVNRNLQDTTRRIDALKYREDIELLPTPYARNMAIALIQATAKSRPKYFFAPWISGDECGGVRAVWWRPVVRAQVRLIIPPDPKIKIRIYHEFGENYALDYNVSGETIGGYIEWLCKIRAGNYPKPEKLGNTIADKIAIF